MTLIFSGYRRPLLVFPTTDSELVHSGFPELHEIEKRIYSMPEASRITIILDSSMIGHRFRLKYIYRSIWPPAKVGLERDPLVTRERWRHLSFYSDIQDNVKGDINIWFCSNEMLVLTRGVRSYMAD